ncbi:SixA phosphatase family protein [Demequina aurantiaca]|uniref:SixA phosphatase family protein n=1 Tax=Demequina aurantiaca TaxID=676200 RepID=UPI000781CE80|nr:histidine phosphatase family protein [Demequina aurantiaca]
MPTLLLVRHAKAEPPSDNLSDHDRSLTLPGRTSATELGEVLREAGLVPDVVLVSSAVRTQQTWKLMSSSLETADVRVEEELYETHVGGVQELLAALEGEPNIVAVIGHEPTMSATAAHFAGPDSDTPSLQRIAQGLPTGNAASLVFEGTWASLDTSDANLNGIYATRALY